MHFKLKCIQYIVYLVCENLDILWKVATGQIDYIMDIRTWRQLRSYLSTWLTRDWFFVPLSPSALFLLVEIEACLFVLSWFPSMV